MATAEDNQNDLSPQNPITPRTEYELHELYGRPILEFLYSWSSEDNISHQESFFVRIKEQPSDMVSLSALDSNGERVFLSEGYLNKQKNTFYEVTSDSAKIKNAEKIYFSNSEAAQRNEKVREYNRFPSRFIPRLGANSIANIIIGLQMNWNSSDLLETGGKITYSFIQTHFSQQITTTPPSPANRVFNYSLAPNPIAR